MDMKLEVVVLAVADVGRAKDFYDQLGWRLDAGTPGSQFRPDATTAAWRPPRWSTIPLRHFTAKRHGWLRGPPFPPGRPLPPPPRAGRPRAAARGEHENRLGAADRGWRDWYAAYMVAEQAGTELPR